MSAIWWEATRLEYPVFPCAADKTPTIKGGFKSAVSDPELIEILWRQHHGPLIGVPTGISSGFSVVDVDPQGKQWMIARINRGRLPSTRIHQTPRGGFHFLYQTPDPPIRNSASKLAWGVDIRGEGGYVIFPPSPGYEVIDESPIAPFPRWIIKVLAKADQKPPIHEVSRTGDSAALEVFVTRAKLGERNNRLFWAACRLKENGNSSDAARLLSAAQSIGLPETEARKTIASALASRVARNGK